MFYALILERIESVVAYTDVKVCDGNCQMRATFITIDSCALASCDSHGQSLPKLLTSRDASFAIKKRE